MPSLWSIQVSTGPHAHAPRQQHARTLVRRAARCAAGKVQQAFEGWGTSLCWFANVAGAYPDPLRTYLADLLFDPARGLGLQIARYNIGGSGWGCGDVANFRFGANIERRAPPAWGACSRRPPRASPSPWLPCSSCMPALCTACRWICASGVALSNRLRAHPGGDGAAGKEVCCSVLCWVMWGQRCGGVQRLALQPKMNPVCVMLHAASGARTGHGNWEADAAQRWMLLAARDRGATLFEAFSNSPPYWMTVSGRGQRCAQAAPSHCAFQSWGCLTTAQLGQSRQASVFSAS